MTEPIDLSDPKLELQGPKVEQFLERVGELVAQNCPVGFAFTILVFEPESQGSMFTVSSVNETVMFDVLKQYAQKLKDSQATEADST